MNSLGHKIRRNIVPRLAAILALLVLHTAAFAQTPPPIPQFATLNSFTGGNGFRPMSGLIQGADGALYGTTQSGGGGLLMGLGTTYRFDRVTHGVTAVHTFFGGGYGPYGGVTLAADGLLYGSTYNGSAIGGDFGTLYRVAPNGQSFATLYSFSGGADGASPRDFKLTQASDGLLYGTTSKGGANGGGTLFRLDPATLTLTTLHAFNAPTAVASNQGPGLVAGRDGYLYGTTFDGGANGFGSVFRFDPRTAEVTTLHEFVGTDGWFPVAGGLMQAADGHLYGTTSGVGSVYKLNPVTLAFTTLHMFVGATEGRSPRGGVTEGADGYLYGTAEIGGTGFGTIYRLHPGTLAYETVFAFSGTNGQSPVGNLLRTDDGTLYGVTQLGGPSNGGTLFSLTFPAAPPPDTTPPVIASLIATPNVLKPASGKMIPVAVTVAVKDAVDPAPQCKITGVTSNQAISGDWLITGDMSVKLRARQSGRVARLYTIAVQCKDVAGNAASATVGVTVPR